MFSSLWFISLAIFWCNLILVWLSLSGFLSVFLFRFLSYRCVFSSCFWTFVLTCVLHSTVCIICVLSAWSYVYFFPFSFAMRISTSPFLSSSLFPCLVGFKLIFSFKFSHRLVQKSDFLICFYTAPGISASPSEDNARYFDVMILGPDQSPYEGTISVEILPLGPIFINYGWSEFLFNRHHLVWFLFFFALYTWKTSKIRSGIMHNFILLYVFSFDSLFAFLSCHTCLLWL